MAITDKKKGPWGLDQVYNKINQGSIWSYSSSIVDLFGWGSGGQGGLGLNDNVTRSSPIQIPGTTWGDLVRGDSNKMDCNIKTDGTLWAWGGNNRGQLGQNNSSIAYYSSPIQISGTTWNMAAKGNQGMMATRTDGTLWSWGYCESGEVGSNQQGPSLSISSPTQIPGTTWGTIAAGPFVRSSVKTDGTLWIWGVQTAGVLGQNETYSPSKRGRSSPVQIPGTTWKNVAVGEYIILSTKTDGSLWSWGLNNYGQLGQNNRTKYSSPVQVGSDTSWAYAYTANEQSIATKTDGTLWVWGDNAQGQLGQNDVVLRSSPTQVPGTWDHSSADKISTEYGIMMALKTNKSLWVWGLQDNYGVLGQNQGGVVRYSSPVQITGDYNAVALSGSVTAFAKKLK